MGRVSNKVALITGGGSGQGAAEAGLLANEGASVVVADIDGEAARRVSDEIVQRGGAAFSFKLDVSNELEWEQLVTAIQERFGALHVLVNNAGIMNRHRIETMPLEQWNRTIAINLTGAMLGMKCCSELLKKSGNGSIVNVCSASGLTAFYEAAYVASKWGLRGLSQAAALTFAEAKVRVNSIHPGPIANTGFSKTRLPGAEGAASIAVPLQRQGTPEECANLVLFLASDESSFITGAEIAIDGGYVSGATALLRNKLREQMNTAHP